MTTKLLMLTTFLSAFLLFSVQPLFAKYLLPFYGGSASVWTVSIFFYSTVLFLGYLYAAVSAQWSLAVARLVHAALGVLVGALLLTRWQTGGSALLLDVNLGVDPAGSVFVTLLAVVGLPVLLLASTSVISQRLFAAHTAADPYWLYAVSNLGSFGGLLLYPLFFEPFSGLTVQTHAWTIGFVGLIVLLLGAWRQVEKTAITTRSVVVRADDSFPRGTILLFAAVPTFLLAAVTETLSQTIASFPLLWVVPLCAYLLSFVFAFRAESERYTKPFVSLLLVGLIVMLFVILPEINSGTLAFWSALVCAVITLFFVCVHFHARAYACRPSSQQLGSFYVWFTLGGALGSGLVGMVLPHLLNRQVELHWMLGGLLIYSYFRARPSLREGFSPRPRRFLGVAVVLMAILVPVFVSVSTQYHVHERNFYGTLKVGDLTRAFAEESHSARYLVNGATTHGIEPLTGDRAGAVASYYAGGSGIDVAVRSFLERGEKPRVAVIGLGIGMVNAYCDDVAEITYIEINPAVVELAGEHFTYLERCPDRTTVVVGDGRLELERMIGKSEPFDIIMMDAFTDDAIPVHLLTREAFQNAYLPVLAEDGIIAFHISNKYLNLAKPIAGAAESLAYASVLVDVERSDNEPWIFPSHWILVTPPEHASAIERFANASVYEGSRFVWTDQKSSVLSTVSLRGSNIVTSQ